MRHHILPYFAAPRRAIVVMLNAGDKSTQKRMDALAGC
jgi:hypothetical protein